MVGLSKVDNTTDAEKVISDKTTVALNLKEAVIVAASSLVKGIKWEARVTGRCCTH